MTRDDWADLAGRGRAREADSNGRFAKRLEWYCGL